MDKDKSEDNTVLLKKYPGGTLHIIGAHSPGGFRRKTKDAVFYDETDGFEMSAGTEGDQFTLGDKRMLSSPYPKSVRGSTPTTVETSKILKSLRKANLVFRFYVACPHCQNIQYLEFGGKDCEYGLTWPDGQPELAKYQCVHCHELIDYSEQADMVDEGQWRTEEGHTIHRETSDLYSDKNKKLDWCDYPHAGFVIWAAYSPFENASWKNIAIEFNQKKDDPDELKAFINTVLGEETEDIFDQMVKEVVQARCEPYSIECPKGVRILTSFTDVQKDRLEILVVGWGLGEEAWSITYLVLRGRPSEEKVWKDHDAIINKTYLTYDDEGEVKELKIMASFIGSLSSISFMSLIRLITDAKTDKPRV